MAVKNISKLILNYNKEKIKNSEKKMSNIKKWFMIPWFINKMVILYNYFEVNLLTYCFQYNFSIKYLLEKEKDECS